MKPTRNAKGPELIVLYNFVTINDKMLHLGIVNITTQISAILLASFSI